MLAFLLSKGGLITIGAALIAGVIGVQTLRLAHAKSDLTAARASLAASESRLKASEALRATEYAQAVTAAGEAEKGCSERVAQAVKSGQAIKRIVEKVPVYDAAHCPVRSLVDAGQLRDALQP